MVNKCCVFQCSNVGGFAFPKAQALRKRWIIAVRRDKWQPTLHSRVCATHFIDQDFRDGPTSFGALTRKKRCLKADAVPSVFQWSTPHTSAAEKRKERVQRRENKSWQRLDLKQVPFQNQEPADMERLLVAEPGQQDVLPVELEISVDDMETAEVFSEHEAPDVLSVELPPAPPSTASKSSQAGESPQAFLSVEALEFDIKLLHYYTGLETFEKFMAVFHSLGPAVNYLTYVRTNSVICISPVNQFVLMLSKLRQDLDYVPLSRMCGVSVWSAENIFITWVNFCSRQWGEVNMWPSREIVSHFAPSDFAQKFPTTRVVLDGTEIPVARPSNPLAQRATFSTYKNKNTVKCVVGITPGGLVSYVSDTYGGAASDRQIVERSDLPQMCDPGDSVMADKGFNVQDLFASNDVQINIPAFFSKKNRLSQEQVLKDRKVSSKRVHVERVIGMAKTYKILTRGLSLLETKLSKHIIAVCFMLCNFRSNVVGVDA